MQVETIFNNEATIFTPSFGNNRMIYVLLLLFIFFTLLSLPLINTTIAICSAGLIRPAYERTKLLLKNGYKGELKKGLTFQAPFVVAERTMWQLLFDKVDDWLNPSAPPTQQTASKS